MPFSRTLRALQSDGMRLSLWGLIPIAALLVAWLAWSVLARVPLYAVSQSVRLIDSHTAVAEFPPAIVARIQPGQPAQLLFETSFAQTAVPATVHAVQPDRRQVTLTISTHSPLPTGLTATAEIETERVSPAALALRLAGAANR